MEGINVFQFQIHEQRRNRSCWCLSIPRAKLILMVAMLCLFFLWWLIFNSVRLEIKDGRITGIQGSEMLHLDEFLSDFSTMDRSTTPPSETAAEPDETQVSLVSVVSGNGSFTEMMQMNSLNESKLDFVSLASNDSPPPHFSTTAIPPPPAAAIAAAAVNQHQLHNQHISNIIRALRGAGGFAGWANLLLSANISSLPVSATLFIPGNDAISHLPTATTNAAGLMIFDPLLIPYHIVPQRLPFSHLQRFKLHTRLSTLLPSKCILITNSSLNNFTIDDARITHPDIFQTPAFAVHGINKILKYSTYGDLSIPSPPLVSAPSNNNTPNDPQEMVVPPLLPAEEVITTNTTSGSSCLCTEFPIILFVLLVFISRFIGLLA